MPREVTLPQLGQTMEEGTIVTILISEGDKVNKGDVLFEIETDKATLEMESPAEGYVKKVLVEAGETKLVNEPILILGDEHEEVSQSFIDSLAGGQGAGAPMETNSAEPAAAAIPASSGGGNVSLPSGARVVALPQLGQTMEEGTIVTCLVSIGDQVSKGDVIFEIETDKATLEMESPAEGTVKAILVEVGETIPVNDPVLILADDGIEVGQDVIDSLKSDGEVSAPAAASAERAVSSAPKAASPAATGSVEGPASAKVVRLPQLGQTMEEGTIITCLISVGDTVGKGDVLFEIETDKATLEMESPVEGTVKAILVETGETVPVNDPILIVADADAEVTQVYIDSIKAGGAAAPAVAEQATGTVPVSAPVKQAPPAAPVVRHTGRIFATPRAKMTAKELGIDLAVVPMAPGALRITEADVKKAAAGEVKAAPAAIADKKYSLGQRIKVNRMQKIVGERMLQSKLEIPCFYLNVRVDMTEIVKFRSKINKSGDVKVSFNDFIIRAVAMGLDHYPVMTGQLDGDEIVLAETIDIGLAISTEKGLSAPIVKDAFSKDVRGIATYTKGLVDRARADKLSLDDLTGGCITVSNLGGFGIDSFIPIVVPGQTSILGVGRINDMCVPMDGNIMIRKMMNLNLSVDHKVANGADAAQFLDFVKKTLEHPGNFE